MEYEDSRASRWGSVEAQHEGRPPDCVEGLSVVPRTLQPYSRVFIGLGPETTGTTALLDALGSDPRVVPIGERDFFSWEQNFRNGIASYLETHRRVYARFREQDAKFRLRDAKRRRRRGDATAADDSGDNDDDDEEEDDEDEDDRDGDWTYEPLPPLEEMVFAEKSPLYGHHPLAGYRLHASLPHVGGGALLRHQSFERQHPGRRGLSAYAAGYPTAVRPRRGSDRWGDDPWGRRPRVDLL